MPYIGRGPVKSGAFRIIDDISGDFDGSDTTFALTVGSTALTVGLPETLLIAVDGVIQEAGTAYTISGSNIVFDAAPQADAPFWGVELGDVGGVASTVAVNTVDSSQIVNGSIDRVHLAADIIDGTKIADDVINSEHYAAASIDNEHLADDAVGVAELSATGTASSSTFLRGDNAWAAAGVAAGSSSLVKVHCHIAANGTLAANDLGVSTITYTSTGNHRINFSTAFAATNYSGGTLIEAPTDTPQSHSTQTNVAASSVVITYQGDANPMSLTDMQTAHVFCGDQ